MNYHINKHLITELGRDRLTLEVRHTGDRLIRLLILYFSLSFVIILGHNVFYICNVSDLELHHRELIYELIILYIIKVQVIASDLHFYITSAYTRCVCHWLLYWHTATINFLVQLS